MNVLKSLNQRGQHNWIKIVCLAVGLATGIVLIGKAGFEQSWDRFSQRAIAFMWFAKISLWMVSISTFLRRLVLWLTV